MKDVKVSIAIATYNGEKYLQEQLDSIYGQTHKNIEVIVCDDCSNDSTVAILEYYVTKFGLKLHINERNIGYVKNFEKAISLCTGDYIALSDQDDIWVPEKLELLVNSIGNNMCIHSDALLIDDANKVFSESYSRYSQKLTSPNSLYELAFNGCVTGCTALFARSFVERILPFPENLDVHDRWIGAVAFSEESLCYLDVPLVKYRQHGNNNIGASNASGSIALVVWKSVVKHRLKLFTASKKFAITYANHCNFIEILLREFGTSFNRNECSNLNKVIDIYKCFISGERRLTNYFKYLKFFAVVQKGKGLTYKIFFFLNVFRELLLMRREQ